MLSFLSLVLAAIVEKTIGSSNFTFFIFVNLKIACLTKTGELNDRNPPIINHQSSIFNIQ